MVTGNVLLPTIPLNHWLPCRNVAYETYHTLIAFESRTQLGIFNRALTDPVEASAPPGENAVCHAVSARGPDEPAIDKRQDHAGNEAR
jgi:hypothetical protein